MSKIEMGGKVAQETAGKPYIYRNGNPPLKPRDLKTRVVIYLEITSNINLDLYTPMYVGVCIHICLYMFPTFCL